MGNRGFFFFFFFFVCVCVGGGGGLGREGGGLQPFQEYFEPIVHQRWAKFGEPEKKKKTKKKKKKKKKKRQKNTPDHP